MPWKLIAILQMDLIVKFDDKLSLLMRTLNMTIDWCHLCYIVVFFCGLGVIMVLAGSFEFDKFHNAEIVERPSDNEEVPMVR